MKDGHAMGMEKSTNDRGRNSSEALRNTEKFKGATEIFIFTCQNNKLSKIWKTNSTHTEKSDVSFLTLKNI